MSSDRVAGLDTMTTTPNDPITALTDRPPVGDLATWRAARDELLVREKAHTREGDAIAAARRRLPMVQIDGTVEVVGPNGPVPFLDLFQGRDELVVYQHMWYDGAPHQGQCEGWAGTGSTTDALVSVRPTGGQGPSTAHVRGRRRRRCPG
jgi:predicted dithiol-disulfide oxidoreductase (DUF899 family)